MSTKDTVFAGSIPANYDQYLVPLLFRPYAELLAQRAKQLGPVRILETACGTGVVTQALNQALPEAEITATDLNPPMIEQARRRVSNEQVHFEVADALQLPFADASFDVVLCQFGAMFFPDKVRGHAEARRVLRNRGSYLLAVWDRVENNEATYVAGKAVADLFPEDSEAFYERIPFRYHDRRTIEADLLAAGFAEVQFETVELQSRAPSAREPAVGLTQGTPMRSELEARGPEALARATDAAVAALRRFEGPDGFEAPMSAHIVTAIK